MLPIPQSTTRRVMLKVFLTGTTTAATGKTVSVKLSKAGSAFADPSAGATNATELASGWYYVDLSTTDTATLGDLIVRGTASGCDDSERLFGVVKATTGGLTALPDAAANANGGLPILSVSGTTLAYTISTVTTYTGDTPQTGDSFARIGATGSGLTSLAPSATALSTAQWTNARAGYLDNLSAGAVVLAGSAPSWYTAPANPATVVLTAGSFVTATFGTCDFTSTMKTSLSAATPAVTVSDKTGFKLASDGLDSIVIESGSACVGVLSGAATATVTIKGAGVATTRVVSTCDSDGNRSALVLTPPA